jgi:hypothetical protein
MKAIVKKQLSNAPSVAKRFPSIFESPVTEYIKSYTRGAGESDPFDTRIGMALSVWPQLLCKPVGDGLDIRFER